MSEHTSPEGQKTVVAFVAGLLVGGLLVWIFADTPAANAPEPAEVELNEGEEAQSESTDTGETSDASGEETAAESVDTSDNQTAELPTGEGSAQVADTTAGSVVTLTSATFPTDDGWVAIRRYEDGQMRNILGAVRYSKSQGLVPESIPLLVPTTPGREYAVVFFTEDGDGSFDLSTDSQIDTELSVFTAE